MLVRYPWLSLISGLALALAIGFGAAFADPRPARSCVAVAGLVGVAIAAFIANRTGRAEDFFHASGIAQVPFSSAQVGVGEPVEEHLLLLGLGHAAAQRDAEAEQHQHDQRQHDAQQP